MAESELIIGKCIFGELFWDYITPANLDADRLWIGGAKSILGRDHIEGEGLDLK